MSNSLPILRLRVPGRVSEDPKEREAQGAACALQSLPIVWYRKVKKKPRQRRHSSKGRETETTSDRVTRIFQTEEQQTMYVGVDAFLSVCDTDLGPVIEAKTRGESLTQALSHHEIVDYDDNFDVISSFFNESAMRYETFLERSISMEHMDFAAPGGRFDLENLFQLRGGSCDCQVKIYSHADQFQLLGGGKKVLLFDLEESSEVDRDEVISFINTLISHFQQR